MFDFTQKLCEFELANTIFYHPTVTIPNIDLLLGAEYACSCYLNEARSINGFVLPSTVFDWIANGSVNWWLLFCSSISSNLCCAFDDRVRQFWEIKDVKPNGVKDSETDARNKRILNTYSRSNDGKFIVRLSLKSGPTVITDNYNRTLLPI